jgi:hypothetical protein
MARLEMLIGLLDRSKKRLGVAFVLALLIHFPLTPGMSVLRLAHRLSQNKEQAPPAPPQLVEVELQEAVRNEQERREAARVEPPSKAASLQMAAPPAAPPQPIPLAITPKPVAEKEADKPKDPKKEKVKEVSLQGGAASKPSNKPAMTLGLWLSSLRASPLGAQLIAMAGCDREWKRFIDQGVDPLNDLEGVLVIGPGLFDSGSLTAAVRHSLAPERVHAVMEALVAASGGKGRWLLPDVASARLGRGQRVLLPQQKDLFFVTPTNGWEALHRVKEPLSVPSAEGRTASLSLVKPNRTLERVGLTLPKRIAELRLEVYANLDESVDIKVELEATSSAAAAEEAPRVTEQLRDFFSDVWTTTSALGVLSGANSGGSHLEVAPRLDLEVEERTLSGLLHLSPGQTRATLNLLASLVCRNKPKAKTAP